MTYYLLITSDDTPLLVRPGAIWDPQRETSTLVWVEQRSDAVIYPSTAHRVIPIDLLLDHFTKP